MRTTKLALMCMAVAVMFCSCGGNSKKKNTTSDGKIDVNKLAEKVIEKEFNGDNDTKDAAAYFFKEGFGIDFKDLEPSWKYDTEGKYRFRGEKNKYSGYVSATARFIITDDTPYTKEDHENNVRRIYALTKAVSENGINMYGFETKDTKDEAMAEKDLEKMIEDNKGSKMFGMELYIGSYGWAFLKDGKMQHCEVSLIENKKEKDENGNDRKVGYKVEMYQALQKSMKESMEDVEKALEDPEVQKQVKKALENY